MKSFQDFLQERCWPGHKPVPGKKPYSPGSCVKETVSEDLRNWFDPNHPKGGWKRVNTKGEVVGDCAREPGEPKPKCMSNAQRASLSKKEKASAVKRKRAQDPNPERQGPPINVKSKVDESMEILNEKNKPTNPELWSRAIAQAKSKFDVYPSAYANGWAAKWYKSKGGGWKSVSEETESSNLREASEVFKSIRFAKGEPRDKKHSSTDDEEHGTVGELEFDQQVKHVKKRAMQEAKEKSEYDYEGDMARGQLQSIINNAQRVHDMLEDNDNLPEWVQSKITLAEDYISTVANYMMSEVDEEVELEEGRQSQRHPLEGHEYHKKSDEALVHIAKDAHAAAEAMKSHNTDAENKYRDQANDSATVRHYRKTHGMADWYKKKYGHIKEEVVTEMDKSQTPPGRDGSNDQDAGKKEYTGKITTSSAVAKQGANILKKLPQGADFAAARRKARLASNGRMDEALSPAIRMQMALQKAKEDRERSERNGEAALAGKFSSGPAKQPMKNPSLVSPKNEQVMDEPNYNNSIQARQKKADEKLPFDEPTRKARGTVKDKSGAVHTAMSRVKDIAKKAARKQAGIIEAADVNDPLDRIDTEAKRSLSKTAGMVKDLATNAKSKAKEKAKKDTFEAEPELSSQIIKQ
jgi:hypothetical protein